MDGDLLNISFFFSFSFFFFLYIYFFLCYCFVFLFSLAREKIVSCCFHIVVSWGGIKGRTDPNMDEDWSDKDAALEKHGLKNFSEEFMRQVVEFADWKSPKTGRGRSWKVIHNRFKAVTNRQCIPRFRKYLEHHGTKRQKTQNLDESVFKKFAEARQKSLVVHDLDIQRWGLKVAKEIKLAEFHASHGWLENFKYRHKLISLKITNFLSHHQVENMDFIEKSKKDFVLEYNEVPAHFKPSEIFNTDQTGVEKELHSTRTISFSVDKKNFRSCSVEKRYHTFLHFTTHYFTRWKTFRNNLFMFTGARR